MTRRMLGVVGLLACWAPAMVDTVMARNSEPAATAQGRRILSTAFVRVGPDNLVTITLRNGRELVLRDLKMGPATYCGQAVASERPGLKTCGRYAEVAAARPGGPPPPREPDLAAPNPLPPRA